MLYLQRYDFKIQCIPGKQFIVADALSRSALPDTTPELTNAELESHIHLIRECLPVSEKKLKEIQDETMKDSALSKVCYYINNGWPTTCSQVMTETKPFFNICNELTVVIGIIFKRFEVVIPKSMQQSIIYISQNYMKDT